MKLFLQTIFFVIIFIGIIYKNKFFKYLYFLFLIWILLFRETNKGINFDFYLIKWIYLLDNKIVFKNIIGNFLLFMPLGLIIKKNRLIKGILIILIFENLQYILEKGILDIVDIFLNYLGYTLVIMIKEVKLWRMKIKLKNY